MKNAFCKFKGIDKLLQVLIFLKSNLPQFLFFLFPSPNLTILILILLLHPKHSTRREKISYICGLRTRIGCERVSEHSTHSDRVTNIGCLLSSGSSTLPAANYYLSIPFFENIFHFQFFYLTQLTLYSIL